MGIGIALSGGGIRGIAHVGVLKALEEKEIKIEAIGGTSAGSIVATLYAMGYKPYYIYVLFKKYAQEIINIGNAPIINGIGNFVKSKKIGISGLNDGTLLEKMFNELALRKGVRVVGDIKRMPLVISAVDIAEAKEYIFTNCAQRNNPNNNKSITDFGTPRLSGLGISVPTIRMAHATDPLCLNTLTLYRPILGTENEKSSSPLSLNIACCLSSIISRISFSQSSGESLG